MSAAEVAATWLARLWCLSIIGGCLLVAKWAVDERRIKRADVRLARSRGYALFLEATAPADWRAVQDAVNRVQDANRATLADAETEARWTA